MAIHSNSEHQCNMQYADGPISEKLFPPPIMMSDTTSLDPFFIVIIGIFGNICVIN